MKTLFKLFIVAAFSIISLSLDAQNENIISGRGRIEIINSNGAMVISNIDYIDLVYEIEKPKGAFKTFKPGDIVTFEANVLPNGKVILKEMKLDY
jgi:hypothetical protein